MQGELWSRTPPDKPGYWLFTRRNVANPKAPVYFADVEYAATAPGQLDVGLFEPLDRWSRYRVRLNERYLSDGYWLPVDCRLDDDGLPEASAADRDDDIAAMNTITLPPSDY